MFATYKNSLFIVVAVFFGFAMPAFAADDVMATSTPTTTPSVVSVEARVREYFFDLPVMVEIARCESKFKQFADSGAVLRGGAGGGMIGVFQFYESVHATTAQTLGFDLETLEGNLGYARHLYEQSGTTPWNSAASCWKNTVNVATPATNKELEIQLLLQVITLLKQLLALQLAAR